MQIKVMSYNTWLGNNIERLVKHIADVNPDIAGLQEIMENYPNDGDPCTAKVIIDRLSEKYKLSYYLSYFPAFVSDRHPTKRSIGSATISKFNILKSTVHHLSTLEMYLNRHATIHPRDAEPRIAIETLVQTGERSIRIFNVHLGVSCNHDATKYSDIQFQNLLVLLGDGKNTILMGDFNNTLENPYMQQLEKLMINTDKVQKPTWPFLLASKIEHHEVYGNKIPDEDLLTHRIDQIYVGKDLDTINFTLGNSRASDHKSLIAELVL